MSGGARAFFFLFSRVWHRYSPLSMTWEEEWGSAGMLFRPASCCGEEVNMGRVNGPNQGYLLDTPWNFKVTAPFVTVALHEDSALPLGSKS